MAVEEAQESPEELLEYWTAERVEEALARPADVPVNGSTSASRLSGEEDDALPPVSASADAVPPKILLTSAGAASDVNTLAAPTVSRSERVAINTAWPNRAVGKLLFTAYDGEPYSCSAAAITSSTKNAIWTAAHCLHEGNGGNFHTGFIFLPAYEDGWYPGFWFAQRTIVPSDWVNNRDWQDADLGAIVLQPHSSHGNLEDYVGAMGYYFGGGPEHTDVNSYGYPANGYNRPNSDFAYGEFQMYCRGNTVDAGNWQPWDERLRMNCDMGGGASGGPLVLGVAAGNAQIVGANSHREADSNGNWANNYLFSSEHTGNAVGVINSVNS